MCSGRRSRARRGVRVLASAAQRAARSKSSTAVATRREHGRRAQCDVAAGRTTGGTLQTAQIIHTNLVGLLLSVVAEAASIAAAEMGTTAWGTALAAATGVLLSLLSSGGFGL